MVGDARAASALLKPLRQKMLQCLEEPDSAAGLARRLGLPRQRLNYHLRELEKAGLVELAEERGAGACAERLFRTRAEAYLISPEALGVMAPSAPTHDAGESGAGKSGAGKSGAEKTLRDRFSWAHLVTLLGKALRDLTVLRRRADRAQAPLATISLESEIRFRSAAELARFSRRLTATVAGLVAEFHDEDSAAGRPYQLVLGCYPTVTERSEDPSSHEGSER